MIVKNTLEGPIFCSIPVNRLLHSGTNDIPTAEYKELRPHLTAQIAEGHIVELGEVAVSEEEGKGGKPGKTTVDVSKVKEFIELDAAVKKGLVKDCVSLETLDAWLEAETDPATRLVLERRADEIKNYQGEGDQ